MKGLEFYFILVYKNKICIGIHFNSSKCLVELSLASFFFINKLQKFRQSFKNGFSSYYGLKVTKDLHRFLVGGGNDQLNWSVAEKVKAQFFYEMT